MWILKQGTKDVKGQPQRVHDAQWLLLGHNVFGHAWYHGPIDGIFGAQTAAAAKQAKYDIGYRLSAVEPTYGPTLRGYLLGDIHRDANMRARARSRQAKFIWPTNPRGIIIGRPGMGTHSYTAPPNNWESDAAYDISVPIHSDIIAVADGTIGPEFGSLHMGGRFAGLRCHLITADNEFYYAHLSAFSQDVRPGSRLTQGSVVGKSGSANGVAHLHIGMKHLIAIETFK